MNRDRVQRAQIDQQREEKGNASESGVFHVSSLHAPPISFHLISRIRAFDRSILPFAVVDLFALFSALILVYYALDIARRLIVFPSHNAKGIL